MKNLLFLLSTFFPLTLFSQSITVSSPSNVPICAQSDLFTVTLTVPSPINSIQFNIENSINTALPASFPNPPVPGGGPSVSFNPIPPCYDGATSGNYPIRIEGISFGPNGLPPGVNSNITNPVSTQTPYLTTIEFTNITEFPAEITIQYRIRLDCSLIPPEEDVQYFLVQNYSHGNAPGTPFPQNSMLVTDVYFPFISMPTGTLSFEGNYLQTSNMIFQYKNTQNDAFIEFSFDDLTIFNLQTGEPDPYTVNQVGSQNAIYFAVLPTSPAPLPSAINTLYTGGWQQEFIPAKLAGTPGYSLYVRQEITITGCTHQSKFTQRLVEFKWRCDRSLPNFPNNPDDMCDISCQHIYQKNYSFTYENPNFSVERIEPQPSTFPNATFDNTCPGNTMDWKVKIKNNSMLATIPEIKVGLNSAVGINILSLIANNSPQIFYSSCGTCATISPPIPASNPTPCSATFPNAIESFDVFVTDLAPQEEVIFTFSTFRCCDGNPDLFDEIKLFNHWRVGASAKSICNGGFLPTSNTLAITPFNGISTNNETNLVDIKHNPVMTTQVMDVTAQCSLPTPCPYSPYFSSPETITIEHWGLFGDADVFDMQVAGNTSSTAPQISGILRAQIIFEQGLVIEDPDNDVTFTRGSQNWPQIPGTNHMADINGVQSFDINDNCEPGSYFFYFRTSDILNPIDFLEYGGEFNFTLLGCCPTDDLNWPPDYEVKFSFLMNESQCNTFSANPPNPPSCNNCCWLPLSSVEKFILVNCPGCISPGIQINDYEISRVNFGLEDEFNDGIADGGGNQIDESTYPAFGSVKTERAIYGDELEDYLTAHFQQGDQGASPLAGYNYNLTPMSGANATMTLYGATLPYLQLHRTIGFSGADDMNLEVLSFHLIISDFSQTAIEIDLEVTNPIDIGYYLERGAYPADHEFLYSFIEADMINKTSPGTFKTTNGTFTGYYENQRYDLYVKYRVCGNFYPPSATPDAVIVKEDVVRESIIMNQMWLSGTKWDLSNHGPVPFAPSSICDVEAPSPNGPFVAFNVSPNIVNCDNQNPCTGCATISLTSFSEKFKFICKAHGGAFYFLSVDPRNYTHYSDLGGSTDCEKMFSVTASSTIARNLKGYGFPYEFRPPPLLPNSGTFMYPSNHYELYTSTTNPLLQPTLSSVIQNPSPQLPDINTQPLVYTAMGGQIEYNLANQTTGIECRNDQNLGSIGNNNPGLFMQDERYTQVMTFYFKPEACGPPVTNFANTDSEIIFSNNVSNCSVGNGCSGFAGHTEHNSNQDFDYKWFLPKPNLFMDISVFQSGMPEYCWEFTLTNPPDINEDPPFTGAPNLFFAVPTTGPLSGWQVNIGGNTYSAVNGIIGFGSIGVGQTITGTICADYECDANTLAEISWGWNCAGVPLVIDPPPCTLVSEELNIENYMPVINIDNANSGTSPQFYVACDDITVSACFVSLTSGAAIPQQINITDYNLPPVFATPYTSLTITNCDLTINSNVQPIASSGQILDSDLIAIGIGTLTNGYFANGECFCVNVTTEVECAVADPLPLPVFELVSESYCGGIINTPLFIPAVPNDPFNPSNCTNCFTITKALDNPPSPVYQGQEVTYAITVCGNNSGIVNIDLEEYFPTGFIQTGGQTFPVINYPFPAGIHCETFLVTGIIGEGGLQCNEISLALTGQSPHMTADVCVDVIPTCWEPGFFYFFDPVNLLSDILPQLPLANTTPNSIFGGITLGFTGDLIIDINYFTFDKIDIIMEPGTAIYMVDEFELTLQNSTRIYGCDYMWQGIFMPFAARFSSYESEIYDANVALNVEDKCNFTFKNSYISDCVTGILVPPNPMNILYDITGEVVGTKFDFSGFKIDYIGQPPHGAIPMAGMDISHVKMDVGYNGSDPNLFQRMSNGIIGRNSILGVTNSQFVGIKLDPVYTPVVKPDFNGTAVSSFGTTTLIASLRFSPLNNQSGSNPTIYLCDRGVFTHFADAVISKIDMRAVNTGIFSTQCKYPMSTIATQNTIYARDFGIDWRMNDGANSMRAQENVLYMSGYKFGIGINLEEVNQNNYANYNISFNHDITLFEGYTGINASGVGKAEISYNTINQISAASYPTTEGIVVKACDNSMISCNNIAPNYYYGASYGITQSESTNSTIECNNMYNHATSMTFNGPCGQNNVVQGNKMNSPNMGLLLNSNAIIGIQPHRGNQWINIVPSNTGALNQNTSPGGVPLNQFEVHTLAGTNYHPSIVNPSNWFFYDPNGSPFDCSTYQICNAWHPGGGGDEEKMRAIAQDSTISTTYPDETLNIEKFYLYEYLSYNDSLRNNDTVLYNFYYGNQSNALGQLYEVKDKLGSISRFDSLYKSLISSANNLLQLKSDSVYILDSLQRINPSLNLTAQREALISDMNLLKQTIENLNLQRKAVVELDMDAARNINAVIVPAEVPESNDKSINEYYILFEKYGQDTLAHYYNNILAIAQQCPHAGGKSVHRARSFVALFNDSIIYQDTLVCLQQGIYRSTVTTKEPVTFLLIPNPADKFVEIRLSKQAKGVCRIKMMDALGTVVKTEEFNCEDLSHIIKTHELSPGAYLIGVSFNGELEEFKKLIIVR